MERSEQFIGQSLAFLDAVERASRAAPLNRPVLVIGERGTGKELIAERLHNLSSRWAGPLIIMNCAALPENLIEAELFGHEAGSFTGAAKTRPGRVDEAYPWPGNVRELRNVVERAVYRHEDPERPVDQIQFDPFHSPWAPAAADTVQTHAAAASETDAIEGAAEPLHLVSSSSSLSITT